MSRNELIADVYRAKLVYQAEMMLPEYRVKGEEDFEFIGKALAAKGYRKSTDLAREIIDVLKSAGIDKWRYPVIAEIEKKYTEARTRNEKVY